MQETLVQFLSWEDPLKDGMATHPLQYSCLENPHGQGAWWATVHRVSRSRTQLSDLAPAHAPSHLLQEGLLIARPGASTDFFPSELLQVEFIMSTETRQRVSDSFPLWVLLLLLLLSRFCRVRLCATSETAAHQAPLSLGFTRQEHWSGLPFPSPMHESESQVAQSCLTQRPHGLQPTRLLRPST